MAIDNHRPLWTVLTVPNLTTVTADSTITLNPIMSLPGNYISTATSTTPAIYITRENLDNIINNLFDILEAIHHDLPYMHPLMLELEKLANLDNSSLS